MPTPSVKSSVALSGGTPKQRVFKNNSMVKLGAQGENPPEEILDLTEEEKLILANSVGTPMGGAGGGGGGGGGGDGGGGGGGGEASTSEMPKSVIPSNLLQEPSWCFMLSHKGIDPKNKYMRYWDLYTIVLLIYTAIVTPYEAGAAAYTHTCHTPIRSNREALNRATVHV